MMFHKRVKIRQAGKRGLVITFPTDLADTIGLKPGDQLETWKNHRGEFFARPVDGGERC